MRVKICSKCKKEKPETEFRKHKGTKDGFQYHCKVCQSAYYYNSENYQKIAKEGSKKRRNERKQIVNEWKSQGCFRCGYNLCLAAIDCHHVEEKENLITYLVRINSPIEKLKLELKKCVPLCSRCHRELHFGIFEINLPLSSNG